MSATEYQLSDVQWNSLLSTLLQEHQATTLLKQAEANRQSALALIFDAHSADPTQLYELDQDRKMLILPEKRPDGK